MHCPALSVALEWGDEANFPAARNFAMTDGKTIFFSRKVLRESKAVADALLRHEISHAILLAANCVDHTERDCDEMAEAVFGKRLYYDDRDVETLTVTNKPVRPRHLPK